MKSSRFVLCALTVACASILAGNANAANPPSEPSAMTKPAHQALTVAVFNPGEEAIFAVSSVLVEGKQDAILIDAQFSAQEAARLAARIKASGKRLTTIYISHGDPDYYFGLDTLVRAFPQAKVVATAQTVAHINASKDAKLKIWGPELGDNAPRQLIVPQPLDGDTLTLEDQGLKIIGLDGPTPDRTFVWIPSIKTVAGGIPVQWGEHVWMADTQSTASHEHWLATLEQIKALAPVTVIPGHFDGQYPQGLEAVQFTADYIREFDVQTAKAKNAAELIGAMKQHYPQLAGESSLELSAKVAKGEMQW